MRTTVSRPVAARARRRALMVASVPEETNRTRATEGRSADGVLQLFGIAGQGGATKGTPTGGAMNKPMTAPATTGANAPSSSQNMKESNEKNNSPASSSEGIKQHK